MSMSIPWPAGRCEDQQDRPVNIDELKGLIGKNPLTDLTGFEAHINKEIKDYRDTPGMSIHCEVDSERIEDSVPEVITLVD